MDINELGGMERDNQYTKLGMAVFKVFQKSENQGADCPIPGHVEDCEDCPFSLACDMVIEIERQQGGEENNNDK
ncbi:hypothetical protein [Sporomusa sp. KB1]|uniref:hypothetical protein n=1 Tax=Sporomusa sp. KB1 TaxID=943346 RepID=UPI001C95B360|nr:hypothetical protein [Sporomusa sp. KB1]